MRLFILIGCSTILAATSAWAAEPKGDWMVENQSAHIRIDNCGGALWGIVSWEKQPGHDTENPEPALRGRPTLGMPVLLDMRPAGPQRWNGTIYNAQNGKTYTASITLTNPEILRVEGCILGGFFCGGQNWTRVAEPLVPQARAQSPAQSQQLTGRQARGNPKKAAPAINPQTEPVSEVCSQVANSLGAAPSGRAEREPPRRAW